MEKVYSLIERKKTEYINNRKLTVNGLTVGYGSHIMVPDIGLVQVLGVTEERHLFCLCKNILFNCVFDDKADWSNNDYKKSIVRKNLADYCQEKIRGDIRNSMVKVKLEEAKGEYDKLFLLSKEDVEMLPRAKRICNDWWWLRSPYHNITNSVWFISADGSWLTNYNVNYTGGVRPAFFLDLNTAKLKQGEDGIIEIISEEDINQSSIIATGEEEYIVSMRTKSEEEAIALKKELAARGIIAEIQEIE